MLDFNLGSIFSGIQQMKDEKEREAQAIVAIGYIVSAAIMFNYSLGKGLQMKSPFLKWLGYCFTHVAGSIYKIALTQTIAPRMIIAAPKDLVENTALLDSIHVEQVKQKV